MRLDEKVTERFDKLIVSSHTLARGSGQYDSLRDYDQQARCAAWLATAAQLTASLIPNPDNVYRRRMDKLGVIGPSAVINQSVREGAATLVQLREDLEGGFVGSFEDRASAATFDDLLDHAEAYLGEGRKEPAGVLAGVVFEDAIRRIYRAVSGKADKGTPLDELINALKKLPPDKPTISGIQGKRAVAAAGLRTSATHAQWDEFKPEDVAATITFAREFLEAHLGG